MTNGPSARALSRWMDSAMTSLPVPVSPSMSTVTSVPAAFSRSAKTRRIATERPTAIPIAAPKAAPATTSDARCSPAHTRSRAATTVTAAPRPSAARQPIVRGARHQTQASTARGPATCVLGKDSRPLRANRASPGRGRAINLFSAFPTIRAEGAANAAGRPGRPDARSATAAASPSTVAAQGEASMAAVRAAPPGGLRRAAKERAPSELFKEICTKSDWRRRPASTIDSAQLRRLQ